MITEEHLKQLISQGETTTVQFKVRVNDAYKIGGEMVAFSNTHGGLLIVGIDDKTGKVKGLSFEEIQRTNALLVNVASENVKPAIVITTETLNIDGQNIVVADISKGKDKPYKDNKGIIWVKNGSDKRKVFSGSGVVRAMKSYNHITFDNNYTREEFVVSILRPKNTGYEVINEVDSKREYTVNQEYDDLSPHEKRRNEVINEAISKDAERILSYITSNPMSKQSDILRFIGKSLTTTERCIKILKKQGFIEYVGSKRSGGYRAIKKK
ncbi:MAG: putative DNA binding domain-containing protein [Mediterranea sp.]|jgi:predicted HTH transcriptional regulator|nr:putative DNA binding domain-containing protein [Mediterranea sp.]